MGWALRKKGGFGQATRGPTLGPGKPDGWQVATTARWAEAAAGLPCSLADISACNVADWSSPALDGVCAIEGAGAGADGRTSGGGGGAVV